MGYRIVLMRNGEYKKTLYRCRTKETAYHNYRYFKKDNESILFPKHYINSNGIKEVKYKLLLVKDIEENDKNRFVRDEMGKLYEEQPLGGIWTILESSHYNFEETFFIYGYKFKQNRPTIHEIIKLLMVGAYKKKMVKQVLVIHNKLLIYSEEQFEMIVCKCSKDAERLHHALQKATKKLKIKSLLFLGTASPATISRMYEIIHEKTGWSYQKIYRQSTRP